MRPFRSEDDKYDYEEDPWGYDCYPDPDDERDRVREDEWLREIGVFDR